MPETQHKPRPGDPQAEDPRELPPVLGQGPDSLPAYAELHAISNFSFQRGASHPHELVERAYNLGYAALAITDECSVAGVVRAHMGLKDHLAWVDALERQHPGQPRRRPFRLLYGSEFALDDVRLVAIARDLQGWGGLCEFITAARMAAPKGQYAVDWERSDWALLEGCEILLAPRRGRGAAPDLPLLLPQLLQRLAQARARWGDRLWLAVELPQLIDDALWLATLREAGAQSGVPLLAAGDVHMHVRSRKPLHDVLTAVRLGRPVAQCGFELQPNAERRLRARAQLAELFPPELLARTLEVVARCRFELDELRYNYPLETVPAGQTPGEALARLTMAGARQRYPAGVPFRVRRFVYRELRLIAECRYEMFFLTVEDIVRFARGKGILCQGRGSAANSVVCYCLGITAMDPMHSNPLLERFISHERRHEPPDIDVDFEHERREEVIQYIYAKYGRDRAAIAAVVIAWRTRSAIRDAGQALGLPAALVDAFAREHHWFDRGLLTEGLHAQVRAAGLQRDDLRIALWLELTGQLIGFPRHLSQHVGGFVLTQDKLTRLVPVENAAMAERSVIQWDKDDLEEMGLMKVDVLALGMLSAIRRCLHLRNALRGLSWGLADIPTEDAATYAMIRRADTVGVFQIESRAQMSMLPRLRPVTFYDLVVEVAIVRPGPIVGGMVHPFLQARERQRAGLPVCYENAALEPALGRTLGVPIFQEQVMQIAMIAAGFSAAQADALRRSMAAWKRKGGVHRFHQPIIDGMLARGYRREFAEGIFRQILGFGEYGFPESHAYSFALLAYASSWLKCHEPACYLAAMINSQPMGFYAPAQLVQDARRHGVPVLPADVSHSDWDCTLDAAALEATAAMPAVRLGLRLVSRLSAEGASRIVAARMQGPFADVQQLSLRAQLDLRDLNALAAADALRSLAGHRRAQVWEAAARLRAPESRSVAPAKLRSGGDSKSGFPCAASQARTVQPELLRSAPIHEAALELPATPEGEEILFDYAATGLTLRRHPLALLRPRLARLRLLSAAQLHDLPDGRRVAACGLVTVRQQPQTAKGTMFVTLEDETGPINVIVWKQVRERQRAELLRSRLLAVHGTWQRDTESGGEVRHLVALRLQDLTPLLGRLAGVGRPSRDFH